MSTSLIKFEVRLPIDQGTDANGNISAQDTATRAFLASLSSLVNVSDTSDVYQIVSSVVTQYNLVFGLLTSAQATTALGYLNTLNTALIAAGSATVVAYTYPVTSQP
jgi:hypothetical protein